MNATQLLRAVFGASAALCEDCFVYRHKGFFDERKAVSNSSIRKNNANCPPCCTAIHQDKNAKYLRVFHPPFMNYHCQGNSGCPPIDESVNIARISDSINSISPQINGAVVDYVMTGAGFSNYYHVCKEDWEYYGDENYNNDITAIEAELKLFGVKIRRNLSLDYKKCLLLGIDICVKYRDYAACDFSSCGQIALCIPPGNIEPTIIWKVYPTKDEGNLIFPCANDSYMPTTEALKHHVLKDGHGVFLCNDAAVFAERGKLKNNGDRINIREGLIDKCSKCGTILIMAHSAHARNISNFSNAVSRMRLSKGAAIGAGLDRIKGKKKNVLFVSGIAIKCRQEAFMFIKEGFPKTENISRIDVWVE